MSYEQSVASLQGTRRDIVWFDEEPEGMDAWQYYSEALTRTADADGIMLVSRTPLNGVTELVEHFQLGHLDKQCSVSYFQYGWNDCPHMSESAKRSLLLTYKPHERACRTEGIPMMGSGLIYQFDHNDITCDDPQIPWTWQHICGLDIGVDHPTAVIWVAMSPSTGDVVVYDEYVKQGEGVIHHAAAIRQRGDWIPCAWPHDALQRDKSNSESVVQLYREQYVNMIHISARYVDETGGAMATEGVIQRIQDMMRTGQLKISNRCVHLLKELRQYHRRDGKIVRVKDDAISALHYAIIMLRYSHANTRNFGRSNFDRQGGMPNASANKMPNPFTF